MIEPLVIKIGGIVYSIELENLDNHRIFDELYAQFQSTEKPDTILTVKQYELPGLEHWELVFDSQMLWALWRKDDQWAISMQSPVLDPPLYQVAVFDEGFQHGTLYLREIKTGEINIPFEIVFAEVLTINLLARGRGVMLHACSVGDGETGRLFSGVSGAGKSTMARLWSPMAGVEILSDDRVILRKRDDRFLTYGTPWHGDARAASPRAVPLEQIFILEHADQNRARRLEPAQAATQLLVRSFPTYWSPAGMDYTLDFLAELTQTVPCYELGFVPGPEVVDFIRCVKSS
jgi:hypothetical protein